MISALIHVARPTDPDAVDRLADTLGALVAGVAAGLVGDAVIVAPSHSTAIDTVAEATGAKLVLRPRGGSAWSAGAKAARREWVLCLEAGDVPAEGWIRILDRFIGTARPDVTLGRLRRPHAGLPARLAARGEGVIGVGAPRPGDLVRRERLLAGPRFVRRVKVRKLPARLERS
ncbi:hypothetical protein [Methylobacterium sp. Leaf112]|jgi:hypothetical protein|uniref:hypothetical protein n=1 Tax=Methylobacterium sp. Leaf112 TaxID=1736258 RepID=UPI0006F274D7|nr:hypothetical protein [Methylobacterium sp. Leaf112]KQP65892.1 hypothetical protein ASF52_02600 [Methylobacterium sp. Leaf112]